MESPSRLGADETLKPVRWTEETRKQRKKPRTPPNYGMDGCSRLLLLFLLGRDLLHGREGRTRTLNKSSRTRGLPEPVIVTVRKIPRYISVTE